MQHVANELGQDTFDCWRSDPRNAADVQELIYDEWETCKCSFIGGAAAGPISVNLPYTLFGTGTASDRCAACVWVSYMHACKCVRAHTGAFERPHL